MGDASASVFKAPPVFSADKPYERWVNELNFWKRITKVEKKQQGIAVALSLPEGSTVREKVFSELDLDSLDSDDGFDKLVTFLDKIYKKDDLSAAYDSWAKFHRLLKTPDQDMKVYIQTFETLQKKMDKYNIKLPDPVLAFQLLESTNLPHKDKQLVLTAVDYSKKDTVYEQMAKSLNKFFGDQVLSGGDENTAAIHVKSEPVMLVSPSNAQSDAVISDQVFYTNLDRRPPASYRGGRYSRYSAGRGVQRSKAFTSPQGAQQPSWRQSGDVRQQPSWKQSHAQQPFNSRRKENPLDVNGQPTRCNICGSKFHYSFKCPDKEQRVYQVEDNSGLQSQEI